MSEYKKEEDKIMTNEEMIEKVENATEDEIVELLKEFAGTVENTEEELNENDLEDVAGGVIYITNVSSLYERYNRLSGKQKIKWKSKLGELLKKLLTLGKVAMPF